MLSGLGLLYMVALILSRLTQAVLTAVKEVCKGEQDLYLDELVFWLAIDHDIVISKSALHMNLKEAGLTRKLLHKIAIEQDAQLLQDYLDIINGELERNSDLLVFADETIKNKHTLAHQYGLVAVGERARKRGYIATKVVPGSFDSFDIFDFVAEQVVSHLLL
jgi:hypothetical protein